MTTSLKLSEVIAQAIIAKLQANMPTRIATINAEKNDGVILTAPDAHRYYTAAKRLIPPGGPAILVMDGPMALSHNPEGVHSLNTQTKIAIWVMDEDADEERLSSRLQRLTRAVIESIWDAAPAEQLLNADGTQLCWKIWPTSTVPGAPYQPDRPDAGSNLREFYLTIFTASRFEG